MSKKQYSYYVGVLLEDETNVCRAIRLADCIMVGTCRG